MVNKEREMHQENGLNMWGALACMVLSLFFISTDGFAKEKKPVALIESISNAPDTEFQSFDYAYHKDKIDLRPSGQAVLAYFDSCVVETVTGGLIKLSKDSAKISKGGRSVKSTRACRTVELALSDKAKEAGASVKRVSPFAAEGWQEWALNTEAPLFKWPREKGTDKAFTFKLYYMDAQPTQLIWQVDIPEGGLAFVEYPTGAPPLVAGMPYAAVAEFSKKKVYRAVFSIDPHLQLPVGPANRLVPLVKFED